MTDWPMYPNEVMTVEGEDWHALRQSNIGGSEIAGLFGCAQPYQLTEYGLWMVKSGRVRDEFEGNERTDWGIRLEPIIAQCVAEREGWEIRKGGYFSDATVSGLGSTLDYIIRSDARYEGAGALEIKNVDGLAFRDKWTDGEPPLHILLQLQHQMAASGFMWGCIAALVNGNDLKTYFYERRESLIESIRHRVNSFWQSIESGIAPEVDGTENTNRILRAAHDSVRPDPVDMSGDDEFDAICREYSDAQAGKKEAESRLKLAQNRLIEKLAGAKTSESGSFKASIAVVKGIPDRVAKPGEIISGRAGYQKYTVKEI